MEDQAKYITLKNGEKVKPVKWFDYSHGLKGAIIRDDHCLVVCSPVSDSRGEEYYIMQTHICKEAMTALMAMHIEKNVYEDTIEAIGEFLIKNKTLIQKILQAAGYVGKLTKKIKRK